MPHAFISDHELGSCCRSAGIAHWRRGFARRRSRSWGCAENHRDRSSERGAGRGAPRRPSRVMPVRAADGGRERCTAPKKRPARLAPEPLGGSTRLVHLINSNGHLRPILNGFPRLSGIAPASSRRKNSPPRAGAGGGVRDDGRRSIAAAGERAARRVVVGPRQGSQGGRGSAPEPRSPSP